MPAAARLASPGVLNVMNVRKRPLRNLTSSVLGAQASRTGVTLLTAGPSLKVWYCSQISNSALVVASTVSHLSSSLCSVPQI